MILTLLTHVAGGVAAFYGVGAPPSSPGVSDLSLDVSVAHGSDAVVHAVAEVRDWRGNLTDPEGFVITFEVESGDKIIRKRVQTDDRGIADVRVIIDDDVAVDDDEAVVRAYWIGSAHACEKNVHLSSHSSHRREVPLMTPVSTAVLICALCVIASLSMRRMKTNK
ncbi:MAG: hypothetical protein N2V77_00420 [Canidatus Methanoxibalbensis ujae]|nr:hypothetical protein [Candidatus Methanoxibalbensis ujae]